MPIVSEFTLTVHCESLAACWIEIGSTPALQTNDVPEEDGVSRQTLHVSGASRTFIAVDFSGNSSTPSYRLHAMILESRTASFDATPEIVAHPRSRKPTTRELARLGGSVRAARRPTSRMPRVRRPQERNRPEMLQQPAHGSVRKRLLSLALVPLMVIVLFMVQARMTAALPVKSPNPVWHKQTFASRPSGHIALESTHLSRWSIQRQLAVVTGVSAQSAQNRGASRKVPREIYGTITGKWMLPTTVSQSGANEPSAPSGNASLVVENTKHTITVPRRDVYQLGLHESSGFASLSLIQRLAPKLLDDSNSGTRGGQDAGASPRAAIDVVLGDILLRDGRYRSKGDVWMNVLGLYSFPDGTLLLAGDTRVRPRGAIKQLYEAYLDLPQMKDERTPLDLATFERTIVEALQSPASEAAGGPRVSENGTLETLSRMKDALRSREACNSESVSLDAARLRLNAANTRAAVLTNRERTKSANESAQSQWYNPAILCPIRAVLHVDKYSNEHNGRNHEQRPLNSAGLAEAVLPQLSMIGDLDTSDACRGRARFQLRLSTANTMRILSAAQKYSLVSILFAIMQIAVILKQMESTNTQASAAKISMLSVGMQAIMDAYMCLMHLVFGVVVQALFNAFATASFFYFVIFSVFEMRYLLMIWKARNWRVNNTGWDTVRRELSLLYSRFYAALLIGVLAIYHMQNHLNIIIFGMYSYWLPQILRTAYLDARRSFLLPYALLSSSARLLAPLYFLGCPSNFLHLRPRPRLCIGLVCWSLLQIVWMESQARWGGRWFIPRRLRPPKYEYSRPFAVHSQGDCVICMQNLEDEETSAVMVTPCDHAFHSECLLKWMEIKLECPTCRRALPMP